MARKPVNGRAKGKRAEREVAKLVQGWWQKFEATAEFVPTPMSGGWGKAHGRKVAQHFNACGDLMTTGARFPFCIEVKWREQWSYDNLAAGKPTPPWQWWGQCVQAANEQQAVPMLWLRKNRVRATASQFPWIVMVPASYVDERRLSAPDIAWPEALLQANGVATAGALPVAYFFDRFLEMSPRRMATDVDV